ncbi:MAG: TlpA family protein disulfide reductase [Desulfobulbus sp.]|jgi:peroxiredoxin
MERMRRYRWILLAAGILLALFLTLQSYEPQQGSGGMTGQQAPDFSVTMLDGSTVSLPDLRGKPVLLEFWAPWCVGCRHNIPPLKQLHERFGSRIALIAVASETGDKTVARFVDKNDIAYPVALSNRRMLNAFQINGIPITVLIDAGGVIRYYRAGEFTFSHMEQQISRLL